MTSPTFSFMPEELEGVAEEKKTSDILEFLHMVGLLKRVKRQGWVNNGVAQPESVAEHMYRMAMITMVVTDPTINKTKCTKMALVHDLAECITGDFVPEDGLTKEEKFEKEWDAMSRLRDLVKSSSLGGEMLELWEEYSRGETPEAQLVKNIDKLEMLIQASEYEKEQELSLSHFFESTEGSFTHPEIIELVKELYVQRANHMMGME